MKVALLGCGFVRDIQNLNRLHKFINSNSDCEFDCYFSTYDVIGLPQKETPKSSIYLKTPKIKTNLLDRFPNVVYELESYEESNKVLEVFITQNQLNFKRSKPGNWEKYRKKTGVLESDEAVLKRCYAQWRKVYKAFMQIPDSSKYDCVIRTRFDYDIKAVKLNKYRSHLVSNKIIYKRRMGKKPLPLISGPDLPPVCFDGFAFGVPQSMEIYCQLGNTLNFVSIINDP